MYQISDYSYISSSFKTLLKGGKSIANGQHNATIAVSATSSISFLSLPFAVFLCNGDEGSRTPVRKYYSLSFFTLFWALKVSLFHQSIPNCLWITSIRLFYEPQIFTRRRNIVLAVTTRLPLQVLSLRLLLSFGD